MKHLFIILHFFISTACFSQTKKTSNSDQPETAMDSVIREASSEHFVVIAGESTDYILLKQAVQDLSRKSGIEYRDEGFIYNRRQGLIWPPDTSANADIYSGSYFMRRYGTMLDTINFLSLEMRDWYFNVPTDKQSLRMILVAGIYPEAEKKAAEERLKEIRKYCPTAYLRKTSIYLGCIH
jgi:hypothetical protein